ncbi:hypothetical protein SB775_23390 [Peribacillus sp. SIMBA_075]
MCAQFINDEFQLHRFRKFRFFKDEKALSKAGENPAAATGSAAI